MTAGATRWRYEFRNQTADKDLQMHNYRAVIDWGADSVKQYWLNTGATLPYAGVVYVYQVRRNNGRSDVTTGTLLSHTEYGWALIDGNPYVASTKTIRDGVSTKEEQQMNGFGNIYMRLVYNTDLLPANARTYMYYYLYGGYEASTGPHIRNRMTSATVTAGGQTYTRGMNTYDGLWTQDTWGADPTNQRLHDAAYGTSYTSRGNLRTSWAVGGPAMKTMTYDIGGNVISTTGGGGPQVDTTFTSGSNYMLPSTVTPNGEANLATSAQWDSLLRLTSVSGPNGMMTVGGYDAASRPGTTTSPTGAVTTYTYSNSAPQVTATVNGRWTKTHYDGLGRTVKVESGSGSTTVSTVETEYGPCGCSPTGKVKRVSMPYAPGGTVYWTSYTYDAMGRTLSVILPNNAGTRTYAYSGYTVTVTDPAGRCPPSPPASAAKVEPNLAGGYKLHEELHVQRVQPVDVGDDAEADGDADADVCLRHSGAIDVGDAAGLLRLRLRRPRRRGRRRMATPTADFRGGETPGSC